ncbi:MAG: hypothetical protein AB7N71_12035 [Phycisphaerae bacterium]
MNRASKRRSTAAVAWIGALCGLAGLTGCEKEVQDEFRAAAATSLQQGFNAILTGIVDGVFAVIEPETDTGTDAEAG